jgi:two-component sensor histidine kinase
MGYDGEQRVAKVRVAGIPQGTFVPITSADKPAISQELSAKWQHILDLAAHIIGVPAGLIMRIHEQDIEVFLSSQTDKNPYIPHETAQLQTGLYCETVVGKRQNLMVPNALTDPLWDHNPDIALDMVSYFGVPIRWPDGELFGTFCVLDRKERYYEDLHQDLIEQLRQIIEGDLKFLSHYHQLEQHVAYKDLQLREIHHRVKNHFNMLMSSLALQSLFISSEHNIEGVLTDIHGRISAIANIHQKLYQSNDIESISLGDYLHQLGEQIIDNFSQQKITYLCESEDITVTPDVSVPCGLLLSEWITNSVKHAFKSIKNPEIRLHITVPVPDQVLIHYRDNGLGLPSEAHDADKPKTLGMTLIKHLTKQLGGTCSIGSECGVDYRLTFKLQGHKG